MGDQVSFHLAGARVVPVPGGPKRDLALDRRLRSTPGASSAANTRPRVGEQAIDGPSTRGKDLVAHSDVEIKVVVALERRHKNREQGLEPLAADPIARFSEYDEGLLHGFVVNPESPSPSGRHQLGIGVEQSDRVLPVISCDRHEMVQDPVPISFAGGIGLLRDHPDQLPFRVGVHLRTHRCLLFVCYVR